MGEGLTEGDAVDDDFHDESLVEEKMAWRRGHLRSLHLYDIYAMRHRWSTSMIAIKLRFLHPLSAYVFSEKAGEEAASRTRAAGVQTRRSSRGYAAQTASRVYPRGQRARRRCTRLCKTAGRAHTCTCADEYGGADEVERVRVRCSLAIDGFHAGYAAGLDDWRGGGELFVVDAGLAASRGVIFSSILRVFPQGRLKR